MVICNIVSDKNGYDQIDKNSYQMAKFCFSIDDIDPDVPTIIYGNKYAGESFNISIESNDLPIGWWVYSDSEAKHLAIKNALNLEYFYARCFNAKFKYEINHIDMIYDRVEDLITSRYPILHKGNHEIYCLNHSNGEVVISSIKRDNIEFCGENYDEVFSNLVRSTGENCIILTWDEIPNKNCKHPPLAIDTLSKMWYNKIRNLKKVYNIIYTNNKYNILFYYYSTILNLYTNYNKNIYIKNTSEFTSWLNEIRMSPEYKLEELSRRVSDIMSSSKLKIDSEYLKPIAIEKMNLMVGGDKRINSVMNNLGSDNTISTKYNSNSITSRMFIKNSALNFITLNNDYIKKSIIPKNDTLVEVDISSFEFSIVKNIFKLNNYNDIHTEAANILGCDRNKAKLINSMILYGAGKSKINNSIKDFNNASEYLCYISELVFNMQSLKDKLILQFEKNGYIKNYFGRIVYPKDKRSVFNNYVQSTGSDIVNLCIFSLSKKYDIVGYKFDSLLLDIKVEESKNILEEFNKICIEIGFEFKFTEKSGKNYLEMD